MSQKPIDNSDLPNITAADTLMGIFGYKRLGLRCPYCDRVGVKRLQCWRARKKKLVCPAQVTHDMLLRDYIYGDQGFVTFQVEWPPK